MKQSEDNKAHIYGFEDYNILSAYQNIISDYTLYNRAYITAMFDRGQARYIITRDLPVKIQEDSNYHLQFTPSLCENHKDILSTAKKVYVHPNCTLSRSMMAEKYKKSLNPFLSDAVVIPSIDTKELWVDSIALFINENKKMIVKVKLDSAAASAKLSATPLGTKLESMATSNIELSSYYSKNPEMSLNEILDSELMYCGDLLRIPNNQSYIFDLLTYKLPMDKIVFEESMQESLGDENNIISFDTLISIKDMLDSSDDNTVSAGLKALSMMDWIHYSNSVKFIFNILGNARKWKNNPAANSTSVKYMMQTISGSKYKSYWPGDYEDKIFEEDYELFKQLKTYYDKVTPEELPKYLSSLNFMTVNSMGFVTPNIRERAL